MSLTGLKLYASAAGFLKGRLTLTTYATGCLRKVHFSLNGLKEGSIPEKYKILGDLNESLFETALKTSGAAYEREIPFKWPVPGTDSHISGRIDFVVSGTIYELKATDSKSQYAKIIKGGKIKIENLAQLVIYMMSRNATTAKLVYSFIPPGSEVAKHTRTFEVNIDDFGQIHLDARPTAYNIQNVLKFLQQATDNYYAQRIWDRPLNWDSKFESPCTYCVFKPACDEYDNGLLSDHSDLLAYGKTLLGDKQ